MLEPACQDHLDDESGKDLLDYNLKIMGINMIKAKMEKSEIGLISSCTVIIKPMSKNTIKRFSIRNWNVKTLR